MNFTRYKGRPYGVVVEPALDEWAIAHWWILIGDAHMENTFAPTLFRLVRPFAHHEKGALVIWTDRGRGKDIAIENPRGYVRTPSLQPKLPGMEK